MIEVRSARSLDCDLLYCWRNDEIAVQNSFSGKPLEYDKHVRWFKDKIRSNDSIILIGELVSKPIGFVRFDKVDDLYVVNIAIDIGFRGNGLASQLLEQGIQYCSQNIGKELKFQATIALGNLASLSCFKKCGFIETCRNVKDGREWIQLMRLT